MFEMVLINRFNKSRWYPLWPFPWCMNIQWKLSTLAIFKYLISDSTFKIRYHYTGQWCLLRIFPVFHPNGFQFRFSVWTRGFALSSMNSSIRLGYRYTNQNMLAGFFKDLRLISSFIGYYYSACFPRRCALIPVCRGTQWTDWKFIVFFFGWKWRYRVSRQAEFHT